MKHNWLHASLPKSIIQYQFSKKKIFSYLSKKNVKLSWQILILSGTQITTTEHGVPKIEK